MVNKYYIYGDSNVYGYDPRDPFGGNYPDRVIWTNVLQELLGDSCRVIADGMNGRVIPREGYSLSLLKSHLAEEIPISMFAVMLGTNDILNSYGECVSAIIQNMEEFCMNIENALRAQNKSGVLQSIISIIGPPPITIPDFPAESMAMLWAGYREIAEKHGWRYIDTRNWNLSMAYDGIHLSEDGHRTFAEKMSEYIRVMVA